MPSGCILVLHAVQTVMQQNRKKVKMMPYSKIFLCFLYTYIESYGVLFW